MKLNFTPFFALFLFFWFNLVVSAQTTYSSLGNGNWNNPATWSPNGVPGPDDVAIVGIGTLTLTDHVTISALYFSAGKITGDSNITVTDTLSWTGGEISFLSVQSDLRPTLTIANTAKASFDGALIMSRSIINNGTIYWISGDLIFKYEVYFDNNGDFYDQTVEDSKIGKSTGYLVRSSNNGNYIKQGGGTTTISIYFSNYGEVNIMAGLLALYPAAGVPPPDTGSFLINEGGILNIGWFARTFEGPVQGAGDVNFYARTNFNFGNSYIKGIYNVTGKTGFYEGKVTFEPTCTLLNLGSRLIPSKAVVVFNTGKTVYLDSLNLYGTSTASNIFSKDSLIIKKYAMFSGGNIGLDLGKTVVNDSATVLIDGPVALHGQFDNYGTMKWVSGDIELKYDQWAGTPEFNNYGVFIDETSSSSRFVKTTNGYVNHYLYNYGTYYKKSLLSTEFTWETVFVNKDSGILKGVGPMIFSKPIGNSGAVSPGDSIGILELKVNYPSEATSSLNIDIGGLVAGSQFDQLVIEGNALLKGVLNIELLDGYLPDVGDIFDIMKFNTRTDTFDIENGLEISNCKYFDVQYSDTAVRLVTYAIEAPEANRDTISERQDTAVEINVLSNDIDPDGDSLFLVHSGIPVHGTSEISGDSTVLYTPEDGFSGMDSLIYIIQKQSGCIDTSWVVINVQSTLGLEEVLFDSPSSFSLEQNFPNPFTASTRFNFSVPEESFVEIRIYDIHGRLVEVLMSERLVRGSYGYDYDAAGLSDGIYFCKFSAGEFIQTIKLFKLK